MITDKRTYVCSPGGILKLPTAAAAIAAPASQFFWEDDTLTLVQGGGAAGTVNAYSFIPAGQVELAPGESSFPALAFTADGRTDFEFYYSREPSGSSFGNRPVYLGVYIDGSLVDSTFTEDTSVTLGRISVTCYTSSGLGTTPAAGTHTAQLYGTALQGGGYTLRVSPVIT
jgi:hypothetical protein